MGSPSIISSPDRTASLIDFLLSVSRLGCHLSIGTAPNFSTNPCLLTGDMLMAPCGLLLPKGTRRNLSETEKTCEGCQSGT